MAAVRKEISKDDYKFFIGRVEKISNGQVAFIADTQKKAVALLGEKIPQNVIDAANNHKAFNIWLGSEVNPIIDSNGYKEEIIVIGDGYDFREVKEYSPSIEKIFATVTTEIKPHIKGKYFMQIDDSWYQQSVRKNFSTLEDAVKIARIMHSELRKVSRHIEATVEARTVDISKYYFRSDDWTKFFEIDNYGNEKVLRRETVEAIAKIDNRTVEEVRNDIGRCTDNYGIYKNSAEVEETNTQATKNVETIYLARTGAYNYELENGERLDDYYFEQKLHAAIKNGAKIKIRNGFTLHGWINFSPVEMKSVEICDANRMTELGDRIDNPIAAIIEYPDTVEETLQAKIAEIKNRQRKSIIDWDDVYKTESVGEIFRLQKDFKKFLKLGEIQLAENVFDKLKMIFRNYRSPLAA